MKTRTWQGFLWGASRAWPVWLFALLVIVAGVFAGSWKEGVAVGGGILIGTFGMLAIWEQEAMERGEYVQ